MPSSAGTSISSVPNEILAAIFEAGHRLDRNFPFELLVSSVTSHWREVALDTPNIWTRIKRRPYQKDLAGTTAYLDRSKAAPFHLAVDIGVPVFEHDSLRTDHTQTEFDNLSTFGILLAPHMKRCNHIEISFGMELAIHHGYPDLDYDADPAKWLNSIIRHFRSLAAPMLRSFEVTAHNDVNLFTHTDTSYQIFGGGTPSLKCIDIIGVGLRLCIPPLSSVHSIQLQLPHGSHMLITCQDLCAMLSTATQLSHLKIIGDIVYNWSFSSTTTLPSLRTIFVGVEPYSCSRGMHEHGLQLSGLLNAIDAPLLELLLIQGIGQHDLDRSPLARCQLKFPNLRWLILEDVERPNTFIPNLAQEFPSVQHLLYRSHDIGVFLSAPQLWPQLRTMAFPLLDDSSSDSVSKLWDERALSANPLERIFVPLSGREYQGTVSAEEYNRDRAYARLPTEFWGMCTSLSRFRQQELADREFRAYGLV
ncbi:hypothetical protein FIBSPDRAFT_929482 [Athelia psychrophila]|uniref:Uncharacterized protein n=1 Tax=Athelia psychrophila TaxID=1759441 RepID=A0A166NP99_9AGAM|nr:hypothetical protein FIBSPDRAFT_929482 [Fibularhizoctonia sp. CBS 109695]